MQLLFPHGFHKLTKDCHPIYFELIGNFNVSEFLNLGTFDEILRYEVKLMEIMERDYYKICSQLKNGYIYGVFSIMDFKGINTSVLHPKIFSYLKDMSILQEYYPDNLNACYVINAGIVFRSIYYACRPLLNEKTKGKIQVFGENYQEALLERIEKENLPTFYGGTCECQGGCLFSNAGPWKKTNEIEEKIPEDIIKKRQELTDMMFARKKQSDPNDTIKGIDSKGVKIEDLENK